MHQVLRRLTRKAQVFLVVCLLFVPSVVSTVSFANSVITQLGSGISGEAALDNSGRSVSLSRDGTKIAIAGPGNDGNGSNAGHVRVYEWDGSSWTQVGADIDGEAAGDESGWSVSLSGDGTRLAVGAIKNAGNGSNAGHVRVYEWDGSSWTQVGADIDGEAAGDESGWSVSLSGDGTRIAIGGPDNDGNGTDSGHARVYDWDGSAWVQVGADIDGEATLDLFGRSVSLSNDGSRLGVGATGNDGNGSNAGHVRIFDWNGSAWVQVGADIDGEAISDAFGLSVSLNSDGTRVAVGAPNNDGNGSNSGHVRIYEWTGTSWIQAGSDINGEAAGDFHGFSVSLSSDGTKVAIGAYGNDANGSNAGHVRVYEWTGTSWIQAGSDINGEAADDSAGFSVSLGGDGNRVAVGEYQNDASGSNAGRVRLFSINLQTTPTVTSGKVDRASTFLGSPLKVATDGNSVVEIVGTYLSDVSSVTVNGQSASFSAASSTRLVFDAPAVSVGTYDLVITNGSGSLTKTSYIQYLARPTLTTDAVINGPAVASQSLTISASTWQNWNNKQYAWYRCLTQVTVAQDGVPADCSAIGVGGSTYELRSADICKFVTLREDLNNGGVYAPYRTVISTTRVLASASPWVLVTDGQNSTAETCSTTSSTVPVATSKSGMNFVEWNTAADGSGSSYQPGAALSLTGNLQLYAIYAAPNSVSTNTSPGSTNTSNPTHTYTGPKLARLKSAEVKPGASVSVEGSKLDQVHLVTVDGIPVEILHQTSSSLELQLPTSLSPGLKDLVLFSDYGKLTVLAFLEVQNSNLSVRPEANSDSKITIGSFKGYLAVYLKGHEGDRLSLRVAGQWIVVNELPSDFERVVSPRTPGELVDVLVYINRRLVSEKTQLVR